MNKAIIIGNLGKDAEVQTTTTGKKLTKLSVATSYSYKNKTTGEKVEKTEWHRITCWGDGLAKYLEEYAKKGNKIEIEGRLQTIKYQGKDGQDRYSTDVIVQGPDTHIRVYRRQEAVGGASAPQDEPEGRWTTDDKGNEGGYESGSFEY